jgi:hypothetical protein
MQPLATSIAFGLLLYAMRSVLKSPACIDCGKRLVHADDCPPALTSGA